MLAEIQQLIARLCAAKVQQCLCGLLPCPSAVTGWQHRACALAAQHHFDRYECCSAGAQVKERLAAGLARTLHEEEDGRAEMGPFTSASVAERCARQLSTVEGLTATVVLPPPSRSAEAEVSALERDHRPTHTTALAA